MGTDVNQITALEREVLGAALFDADACAHLVALVPAERFVRTEHRALAETIERLFSEGHPVNVTTAIAAGADSATAAACMAAVAQTNAVPYQARVLTEHFMAREARTQLERAARSLASGDDVFEVLGRVQQQLSDLQLVATRGGHADTHIRHAVAEALRRTEEWRAGNPTDFAPSGFYSLDRVTGGYPIGELTTLAAMTGAGKTSIVCQVIRALALAERSKPAPAPVIVFSAEMSREQIAHRAAAGLARVNLRDLRGGHADEAAYDRFDHALGVIAGLEIHVDDEPAPTFAHIAARLQQLRQTARKAEGRIALVAVDYDEKIDAEGESEELRVSAIARGLKDLAKRFAAPVLALSQYSRKANHREAPSNEWLRYSGKKEHESAMILHWWHPGYWVEQGLNPDHVLRFNPNRPERGYLAITKNRFGPMGTVSLDFDAATTSFRDPNEPEAVRALRAPSTNGVAAPF